MDLYRVVKTLSYDSSLSERDIVNALRQNHTLKSKIGRAIDYTLKDNDIYMRRFLDMSRTLAYIGCHDILAVFNCNSEADNNYFYGYIAYVVEREHKTVPFLEKVVKLEEGSAWFLNAFSHSIHLFNENSDMDDIIMKYIFHKED